MDVCEYLIVGSGPAGIAAARRLEGPGTSLVDVADEPDETFPFDTLQAALASGRTDLILGSCWEMLANLRDPQEIHPKLRARALRHVMRGEEFRVHGLDGGVLLRGRGSHAAGGMGNAWGAQLLRYTDADLRHAGNWPIGSDDLSKHYADLEAHIGIAGQRDDLAAFLGESESLLPPTPIVPAAEHILSRYAARRAKGRRSALRLGRARLAVLPQPYRGRPACNFGEIDFFSTGQPGIYTPRRTLAELKQRSRLRYFERHRVLAFLESPDHVDVEVEQIDTGKLVQMRTRHLLLGCGAIQTARLVLLSKGEHGRSLPFVDHNPTLLPLFAPMMFGSRLPDHSLPVQLVGTLDVPDARDMISFYYPGGMLWSDLLPDIPLPFDAARKLLAVIMGGMLVAQIWETSQPTGANRLRLANDGSVRIDYPDRRPWPRMRAFLSSLRELGCLSSASFATLSPPTWGFHHAATLPMGNQPKPFETHVDGRLWDSRRVRIIDASVFPSLPAKNHSLTIMANASRIADEVRLCGY